MGWKFKETLKLNISFILKYIFISYISYKSWLSVFKNKLERVISGSDFSNICSLFLVAYDKNMLLDEKLQKQKVQNLLEISLNELVSESRNSEKANICQENCPEIFLQMFYKTGVLKNFSQSSHENTCGRVTF